MIRKHIVNVLAAALLSAPILTGSAVAAEPLASDVARAELLTTVTGKRNATPMDVSKILPRRETRMALACNSSSGCSDRDMESLKFSMHVRDECIYGVDVGDHVETKDRGKYCEIIAESAETLMDFESAAIFRQRACDLGRGGSCKRALKDLEAAKAGTG